MADDLSQYYNDPSLNQAATNAQNAANLAGAYQSASFLLPSKLKQAIQEKLDYNKDIIEQRNKAASEYFQAPSAAREKYQNIWNPAQREALVSRERAIAYEPYANLTDILGQRQGSISDIIQAGTGSFQAAASQATQQAQQAQATYESLFQRAQALADAAEKERQYQLDVYKANKSGSGTDTSGLTELMTMLMGQKNSQENYQEPPMSPVRAGIQYEYPPGSGVIWVSNAQGGWD